ncbi:MAG: hypothetical protein ABWY04_05960 [Arthrobacter sp.]
MRQRSGIGQQFRNVDNENDKDRLFGVHLYGHDHNYHDDDSYA